jgi:hypothetical protein
MSKETVVMLQMMATLQDESKLVDDAIKELTAYKESGCNGDAPFAQMMMLIIKWEQGPDSDPLKVMEQAMKDAEVVQRAIDIAEDKLNNDKIILMGKEGIT